LLFIANQEITK